MTYTAYAQEALRMPEPWTFSLEGEVQGLSWYYSSNMGFMWQLGWGWYL